MSQVEHLKPTGTFVGASYAALTIGLLSFFTGLWNATFMLNEKGYYFAVILLGLFAAVSLQKSVRDRHEGIPVTSTYFYLCWLSMLCALMLLCVGLFNATMLPSEKGFYGISFVLSLFAAITVQKNVRDLSRFKRMTEQESPMTTE